MQTICMFFFANFADKKLQAIIANRFFTWDDEERDDGVCCFKLKQAECERIENLGHKH